MNPFGTYHWEEAEGRYFNYVNSRGKIVGSVYHSPVTHNFYASSGWLAYGYYTSLDIAKKRIERAARWGF